jgi:hypothetical protein
MGSASVQVTVPAERSNGSAALTYIFGKRKTCLADDLFPTLRGITVPCWGVLFGVRPDARKTVEADRRHDRGATH